MTGKSSGKARQTKKVAKKSPGKRGVAQAAERPSRVAEGESASRRIDQRIRDLADWRGETLARMRKLILEADPGATEEWKWMGTPVWSHDGILCTGESYAKVVKLTFARGASLSDPARLFNSSQEGNTRRAIDIHEGEKVDARAFKALVKAAVAHNGAGAKKPAGGGGRSGRQAVRGSTRRADTTSSDGASRRSKSRPRSSAQPRLLAGGNPQIAKGDGDAPVQAYIEAMPGWKRDVGRRIDALVTRSVPGVRKAVKWNSPFYGIDGQGWFLSFHCFTRYLKLTFFRGTSLRPIPPGESKQQEARYLDLREDDSLDEALLSDWVKQASRLPGWGTV